MRTSESWKEWKPVPAGTKCPRITFSFSPTNRSTFPDKRCLGKNLCRLLEACCRDKAGTLNRCFVIPNSWVLAVAGLGFDPLATCTTQRFNLSVGLLQSLFGNNTTEGVFAITNLRNFNAIRKTLIILAEFKLIQNVSTQQFGIAVPIQFSPYGASAQR